MIRAILVDLDGTLADTAEANWISYHEALAEAGVTISRCAFESCIRARNWRQFLPEILSEHGSTAIASEIAARKAVLYRRSLLTVRINTALVSLLESVPQTWKRAMVTSASAASAMPLLEAHGLRKLFDVIITGDHVQQHKPAPEAYILAAEQLQVIPDECLIFEDSDIGVESARAFGGHVLRITI